MLKRSLVFLVLTFVFRPTSHALTNSTPSLLSDVDSVVKIATDGLDGDGNHAWGYCSATLLSPTLMLTAAHCLTGAVQVHSNDINVEVGRYKYATRPDGKVLRIGYVPYLKVSTKAQFLFLPAVQSQLQNSGTSNLQVDPNEDIAVISFKPDTFKLPADFNYAKLLEQSLVSAFLNSVPTAILKTVTVNPWEEISIDTKREAHLNHVEWNNSGWFESTSNSRVQEGDSGSPLLVTINNQQKVVGVVKGQAKSFFSDWDVFALAPKNVCTIASANRMAAADAAILCK